jgi:hypothetical protein
MLTALTSYRAAIIAVVLLFFGPWAFWRILLQNSEANLRTLKTPDSNYLWLLQLLNLITTTPSALILQTLIRLIRYTASKVQSCRCSFKNTLVTEILLQLQGIVWIKVEQLSCFSYTHNISSHRWRFFGMTCQGRNSFTSHL